MKTTKQIAAMRINGDREPYTANDVRDINRASKLLVKFGAISAERAAKIMKQSVFSASWCLLQTGAICNSLGLYYWETV